MKTKKEMAQHFLMLAAAGEAQEAFELYVHNSFIHHNVWYKGDAATLMEAMEENAVNFPGKVFEIQRALEDADLVAVHSRVRQHPGEPGAAVVHIFRFQDAKIIEMWDLGQPVPEDSENEYGMF